MHDTHASPGLWALAWRRLRADRVAMAAMAIVGAFLLMLVLSASGLIVADWEDEVAVNYAPPTFLGIAAEPLAGAAPAATQPAAVPDNEFDPLAADIRELKAEMTSHPAQDVDMFGVKDPLAAEKNELRAVLAKAERQSHIERKPSLPFGADKWGH
ncbi:MAG TPA: ABC transporter permease, partial [Pseudoduganella sp.]